MIVAKTDPFSVRLSEDLYDRLFVVIQKTGGEVTKSELIERAVNLYLAVLELVRGNAWVCQQMTETAYAERVEEIL